MCLSQVLEEMDKYGMKGGMLNSVTTMGDPYSIFTVSITLWGMSNGLDYIAPVEHFVVHRGESTES